jgi:hypothetical protein
MSAHNQRSWMLFIGICVLLLTAAILHLTNLIVVLWVVLSLILLGLFIAGMGEK